MTKCLMATQASNGVQRKRPHAEENNESASEARDNSNNESYQIKLIKLQLYQSDINSEQSALQAQRKHLCEHLSDLLKDMSRRNGLNKLLIEKRKLLEEIILFIEKLIKVLKKLYYFKFRSRQKLMQTNTAERFRRRIKEKVFELKLLTEKNRRHSCPAIHQSNESCLLCQCPSQN